MEPIKQLILVILIAKLTFTLGYKHDIPRLKPERNRGVPIEGDYSGSDGRLQGRGLFDWLANIFSGSPPPPPSKPASQPRQQVLSSVSLPVSMKKPPKPTPPKPTPPPPPKPTPPPPPKPTPPPPPKFTGCAQYKDDHCKCQAQHSCQYDYWAFRCLEESSTNACKRPQNLPKPGECQRQGVHYGAGRYICFNNVDSGDCKILRTLVAYNLGGEAGVGARGIEYKDDGAVGSTHFTEAILQKSEYVVSPKLYPNTHFGSPLSDRFLYQSGISGAMDQYKSKGKQNRCLEYWFPVDKDGMYELSFKTIDEKIDRCFTIQLCNIELARNMFPKKFVSSIQNMHLWMDYTVNFEISKGQTHIKIKGLADWPFPKKLLQVAMCYGDCGADQTFHGAAFSVVQFVNNPWNPSNTPQPQGRSMPRPKSMTDREAVIAYSDKYGTTRGRLFG